MRPKVINDDCIARLKEWHRRGLRNYFHACITDPPYHLGPMAKRWANETRGKDALVGVPSVYKRFATGFMGIKWDSGDIAFKPETWRAIYDVMRPGAYLAAFGGTVGFPDLAVAIADAGFVRKDTLCYLHVQGFPKQHNIAKDIDQIQGREREVIGRNPNSREKATKDNSLYRPGTVGKTAYITKGTGEWEGYSTALSPAVELICLAQKPISESSIAANCLKWGCGAINIEGCRIGDEPHTNNQIEGGPTPASGDYRPYQAMIGKKEVNGRWPTNVMYEGSDEMKKFLFDRSKVSPKMFFSTKVQRKERVRQSKLIHPTVKPIDLMRWLVRLLSPPGDPVILDPFAGSGTTGIAAMLERKRSILIERHKEYSDSILFRIDKESAQKAMEL